MGNFESRIMPFVRQKIEEDKYSKYKREFAEEKRDLFVVYREIDKLFGKPLSAFNIAKIVSSSRGRIVFTIDIFTFKYKYDYITDSTYLYAKSKKWYRRWYSLEYSIVRFNELVNKGKI